MAVKETGVSYYGIRSVEHVQTDFDDIKAHNCTAILLALTEFDLFFYRPLIPKIVQIAKKKKLKVYLNTWGIGKFFGGEPPSLFLQECDISDRQMCALSEEYLPAASPSSPAFREYMYEIIDFLSRECDADGFFWDEPHYAMPVHPVSYQGTADWSCYGPHSQKRFKEKYGYELPKILTQQVKKWRHDNSNEILVESARIAKSNNAKLSVTQCVLPAENNFYMSQQRGFDNWESIAQRSDVDIFSTSIIADYATGIEAHKKIAEETVRIAKRYKKIPQRWVMSYFQSPEDLSFIKKIVQCYAKAGIESIFSWTYQAGKGTMLSAPEPDKVWKVLGDAYGSVLGQKSGQKKK